MAPDAQPERGRQDKWSRHPWRAYAKRGLGPAFTAWFCVDRSLSKDYWGVAFFTVILGFVTVNSIFLDASPTRSKLFVILTGALALVSLASIYAYVTGWR